MHICHLVLIKLIHWDRVMHICISKLTIIGSDTGLSLGCQAIIWTNAGIFLIGCLGTNLNEILIEIHIFSFKKMHFNTSECKMQTVLSQPQCVNQYSSKILCTCYGAVDSTYQNDKKIWKLKGFSYLSNHNICMWVNVWIHQKKIEIEMLVCFHVDHFLVICFIKQLQSIL